MPIFMLRAGLVTLSCVGMLVSPILAGEHGNQPAKNAAHGKNSAAKTNRGAILDVTLAASGTLTGEVRNRAGRPLAHTEIVLWRKGELLQRERTDHGGRFQFCGMRGGLYLIATADAAVACRAWTSLVAPPHSRTSLLIVANKYSARGQQPINERFCANPFLMGTVIAAAIAIPIAVHNSSDDSLPDGS